MVEKLGANTSNSISKKIDYLVIGLNPGSKKQKAEIKTIIGNWLIEVGYEKDFNW